MADDPELHEDRRELYEAILKDFGGVTTWAEFYAKMRERYARYRKCPCPLCTSCALFSFYAFILALEALPEEGDIQKIAEKMAQLLAYKGDAEFGFSAVATRAVGQAQTMAALAEAVGLTGDATGTHESEAQPATEVLPDGKKRLH